MASQGPTFAGTGANDTGTGTLAWTNPGNITASDNTRAVADNSADITPEQTNYLKATNFGFTIPAGATIDGIVVEWERLMSAGASFADSNVHIVKGGTIGTANKSVVGNWPGADAFQSYGGVADLWSETWTYSDINSSTFGTVIAALAGGFSKGEVDSCRITVYYTAAADPSVTFPYLDYIPPRRSQTRVVSY